MSAGDSDRELAGKVQGIVTSNVMSEPKPRGREQIRRAMISTGKRRRWGRIAPRPLEGAPNRAPPTS